MVRCLKCGHDYHVDTQTKEIEVPVIRDGEYQYDDRGRLIKAKVKDSVFVLHCEKCGHLLKKKGRRPFGLKPEELTGEEFREFQRKQRESDYLAEKDTKGRAKRIFEKLKDSGLSDAEKEIEKERMAKKRALNNLVRKTIQKLREASDLPEDEYDKLKEKVEEDIRKIRSGDYDPEELKKETEAVISEIDNAEKREKGLKELEKETERKKKKLEKEGEKANIIGHGKDYFKDEYRDDIKTSKGYDGAHWTEKRDAWIKFYEQEMENLRTALSSGAIEPKEFEENKDALLKYVNDKMGRKGRWTWKSSKMEEHHYSRQLKSVVYLLAAVIVGIVVTATTGSNYFLIAFISVGIYLLVPDPKNIEPRKGVLLGSKDWFKSFNPFSRKDYSHHNGNAFIRSFAKVTAIICFAFAFRDLGDVFNILYIAIAVVGYFLLKVEYDSEVPAEFIESVVRFFFGMFVIPSIFVNIFDSWVLGAIALAFFAVPPLPAASKSMELVVDRGLSGLTAIYSLIDKGVFAFFMLIALVGSGVLPLPVFGEVGWQLSGTLQDTFLYLWIVTAVAGFFSPAKERPVTGAIMLGAATIIYGIGPGSQIVGSGLLGQWWPSVHNTFTTVTEPLSNVMGSLGSTFSSGFLLLTNPVGYATQLMNGSYSDNPTGLTGAYGVDITSMTVTPIFPQQPYVISAIVENNGAFEAQDVKLTLEMLSGDKFTTEGKARTGIFKPTSTFTMASIGFKDTCTHPKDEEGKQEQEKCIEEYQGNLDKLMVWQASFQSNGIMCNEIVDMSLRKKFLPITATVEYDYKSDSRVEVSFMSKAEWDRLAQAGDLERGFGFVESQYSSAPVKFPIGTAGLKNPILETQQFHISMLLDSAFASNSEIVNVESVRLNYPAEWELKSCSPNPTQETLKGKDLEEKDSEGKPIPTGIKYVEWQPGTGGGKTFYCYFEPLTKDTGQSILGGAPTKSYIVTAHAEYKFSRWKTTDTQIEFGGFCCPDKLSQNNCQTTDTNLLDTLKSLGPQTDVCKSEDCFDNQRCINNACVSVGTGTSGGSGVTIPPDFCAQRSINSKCTIGMGACTENKQCCQVNVPDPTNNIIAECPGSSPLTYTDTTTYKDLGALVCRTDIGDNGVCCYEYASVEQCQAAYNEFKRQVSENTALLLPGAYPYEPDILNKL